MPPLCTYKVFELYAEFELCSLNCPTILFLSRQDLLLVIDGTHTHAHFQVQGLEKGVSENEAPGPVGAYTTTHNDTITHTHTHTHTHLRVHSLKKGVSENEAPGPVGAYTTTHNDTTPLIDAESHSQN